MESLEKRKIISREIKERNVESQEKEFSEELKAAAKMERVDFLAKEIKSGSQQIQNIMLHMNQVLNAIKILREQLKLSNNDNEESVSIIQDKKQVEKIKIKIKEHKDEILKMKDDLIKIQVNILKEDKNFVGLDIESEAKRQVAEILKILEE